MGVENYNNPNKDYKIIYDDENNEVEEPPVLTAEMVKEKSENWMYQALESFEKGGMQYSVRFNEVQSRNTDTTIDDLKDLSLIHI